MWEVARSAARSVGSGLLDLLFPVVCAGCDVAIDPSCALCVECVRAIRTLPVHACRRCQDEVGRARVLCSECEATPNPLATATAAVYYEGEAERWIRAFKYPRPGLAGLAPGAGAVAREFISRAASVADAGPPDVIIPIPLHARRLRLRGFNPAAILARHLARKLGAPFDARSLLRIRDTPTQTRLRRAERSANVRGAFACREIEAKTVWLVDDVVTTGSTLEEAARVVGRAGALEVHAVCAARTPRPK